MKIKASIVILLCLFSLTSCDGGGSGGGDDDGDVPSKPVTPDDLHWDTVTNEVFNPACYQCHNRANGVTNGNLGTDTYIEVKLNAVRIYQAAIVDKTMPQGSALTERQFLLLRSWLEAGAPE